MNLQKKLVLALLMLCVYTVCFGTPTYAATKLNKTKITLEKGKSTTLTLKNYKKTIIWKSKKSSIASVNKNGKVTGKKAGTTTIIAKAGKNTYNCTVTVTEPVKLNKKTIVLRCGESYQLKVTGTDAKVSWSSSNKTYATVNKNGKVTANERYAGTIYVTAKVNNKRYQTKVIVHRAELNFNALALYKGAEKGLILEDASLGQGTWISSNPNIVSISNISTYKDSIYSTATATLKAKKEGSATITVKLDHGITLTCNIKVIKRNNDYKIARQKLLDIGENIIWRQNLRKTTVM